MFVWQFIGRGHVRVATRVLIRLLIVVIYLTGGIGIPGAVVGILIGGFLLKRFQLKPKGM